MESQPAPRRDSNGWIVALVLLIILLIVLFWPSPRPAAPPPPEPAPPPVDMRVALLKRYHAPDAVEAAIRDGLAWLVTHQAENGSWRSGDPPCAEGDTCREMGLQPQFIAAATALSAVGLLVRGTTEVPAPSDDPEKADLERRFSRSLVRAIEFLVSEQAENGSWSQGQMYVQGMATLAMVEAATRTGRKEWKAPAQKGIDFIVASQSAGGGWDYYGTGPKKGDLTRSDTSITAWTFLALLAAREARLEVPEKTFLGVIRHLHAVVEPVQQEVAYQGTGGSGSRTCLAIGLFCRLFLGYDPAAGPVRLQARRLLASAMPEDQYFWYHASMAMFQVPEAFEEWNRSVPLALIGTQERAGHLAGSWTPVGDYGKQCARILTTALNVLALEVYFRHVALSEKGVAEFPGPYAAARALSTETDPQVRLAFALEMGLMRSDGVVQAALAKCAKEDADEAVRKAAEASLAALRARAAGEGVVLERTISVDASGEWTSSKIDLLEGETVTLAIKGKFEQKKGTPPAAETLPIPSAPAGAVIARVGLSGPAFAVVPGRPIAIQRFARLYLGVNLTDRKEWQGKWEATATVRLGKR